MRTPTHRCPTHLCPTHLCPTHLWLIASALASLAACASNKPVDCPPAPFCESCPEPGADLKPAKKPLEVPLDSLQHDRERHFSVVAFSADGTRVLIRGEDEIAGPSFQLLDLVTNQAMFGTKAIKGWTFQPATEKTVEKQARKALDPASDKPLSARSAEGPNGLTLVAADVGDDLVVYVMRGERSVPYLRIPRLKAADGTPATVELRALVWDPSGQRAIIIHAQKVADSPAFTSEYLHVLTLDPKRLPFD